MNAKQLERASYMAAHAILSRNTSAPELACPGARRSHTVDIIAETIQSVFELHCSALDESTDWWADVESTCQALEPLPPTSASGTKIPRAVQEVH